MVMRRVCNAILSIGAAGALGCVEPPHMLANPSPRKVCLAPPVTAPPPEFVTPDAGPGPHGPFVVGDQHFAVWDGVRYRPLFVRAINMGASQPGNGPNDLTATYEDYRCWFELISHAGMNAVRLYVPHFPLFYAALADHNETTPERTIYLMQGAYLPEHAEGAEHPDELDLHQHGARFREMLTDLVDIVHGNAERQPAPRAVHGKYEVDVSRWTLAYLVGREVLSAEALATNLAHPEATTYEGARMRMSGATPTEVFMTGWLDHLVDYELRRYGSGRPFAWSNWLELDPIEHPTEPGHSKSDRASADFAKLDVFDAPAGHFISYHAYPYYPNFVSDDPDYRTFSDEHGPNSYLGLLVDLRRHHRGQALFIGEFGVPSSWGRAHSAFSGMHHGGLDEDEQGRYGARMAHNIAESGAAGFAYFQLTDGWWKRIWITAGQTFPHERLRYWHDMLNAQQHYGLIAFQLDAPDFERGQVATGDGRVRELRVRYDAEFVHLRVELSTRLRPDESLVVGLDTYSDERGETRLPDGVRTQRKNEFALTLAGSGTAKLQVLRSYDLRHLLAAKPPPGAVFRSTKSDAGDWASIQWLIAGKRMSDDGVHMFPEDLFPVGRLRVADRAAPSSLDAIEMDGTTIAIKLPWSLLNFAEPPRHMVIDDDPRTAERELAETPGIAYSVSLGGSLLETERIGWDAWLQAPVTRERLKSGAEHFFDALRELPLWLEAEDDRGATD